MSHMKALYVVIPAAGVGRRFKRQQPKQYASLAGKPLIHHTLQRFLDYPGVEKVVIPLAEKDPHWKKAPLNDERLVVTHGGPSRAESVLLGLRALADLGVSQHAWVFVHDAARPCVTRGELDRLCRVLSETKTDGAVLGLPVSDTLRRIASHGKTVTVEREGMWRALTPQVFRLGELFLALTKAIDSEREMTDEGEVMEWQGKHITMVEGEATNIKVTYPGDLVFAQHVLEKVQ